MFVSGYSGIFSAQFDESMMLEDLKTNQFSNEFMKNVYRGKKVDRASDKGIDLKVPSQYTMNDIVVHEDGSLTVLSEFFQIVVTENKGSKITTTTYGNILFFKLDSEGNLVVSDAIKKNQVSSTTSLSVGGLTGGVSIFISVELPDNRAKYWSYAISVKDENIYLVFNDHFKNAGDGGDDLSKAMTNPKRSVPYLVTIKPDGSFTKEAMVSSGDSETYLVPQVTYHLTESEFIIWGIWRKMNKFGLAEI